MVLQTMDSSFVAGTTTDMKGHFLLNKIKKGSYILSVSSLGFKTEYISLESLSKNISLGEISLNDDAVSLDGSSAPQRHPAPAPRYGCRCWTLPHPESKLAGVAA